MSKKLIFGLILAFIGMTGLQFDASAANMCTFQTSKNAVVTSGVPGCTGFANTSTYSCSSYCATGTCILWTMPSSSSTYSACSCSTCDPGSYRVISEYGAASMVNMCKDNVTWQPQSNIPDVYECKSCGSGKYSAGGTATSCTPCPSGKYGGGGDSSSCKSCPTHATCSGTGNVTFKCIAGYYKNGDGCERCPLADGIYTDSDRAYQARYESAAGAESIRECYLPSGGHVYYDAIGRLTYNSTCYYE